MFTTDPLYFRGRSAINLITKELGCFHIIFAQILTAHNFCLTHITASILIYANALGYFLSIKIEFVMRNLIPFFMLLYMERGV